MAIERDFFQNGDLLPRRVVVSMRKVVGEANGGGRRRRRLLSLHAVSGSLFDTLFGARAARGTGCTVRGLGSWHSL
jgi:hypothetical protein